MELVLLVIQIILALLIIGVVLIQRSDNDGFGLGSGGGGGLISARGQANLLTRTTAILAFLFMANSLLLTIVTTQSGSSRLIDDVVKESETFTVPKDGTADQQQQQLIQDKTGKAQEDAETAPAEEQQPLDTDINHSDENNPPDNVSPSSTDATSEQENEKPADNKPAETEKQENFTAPTAD